MQQYHLVNEQTHVTDPTSTNPHRLVAWMILLVTVLAGIDVVTVYMRDQQVRYMSLAICLLLLVSVGMMTRRGRQ